MESATERDKKKPNLKTYFKKNLKNEHGWGRDWARDGNGAEIWAESRAEHESGHGTGTALWAFNEIMIGGNVCMIISSLNFQSFACLSPQPHAQFHTQHHGHPYAQTS